jgi:hypothetical protein
MNEPVINPKLTDAEKAAVFAVREYLKLKLRGANLKAAMQVFESGLINANDTVFVERAQPRGEWLYMFMETMGGTLTTKPYSENQRVLEVFAAINVAG